jgi:hypothetical protein
MDDNNFTGELMELPGDVLGEIVERCGALEIYMMFFTCKRAIKIITSKINPFMDVVDKMYIINRIEENLGLGNKPDFMYGSQEDSSDEESSDELAKIQEVLHKLPSEVLNDHLQLYDLALQQRRKLYEEAEIAFSQTMMAQFMRYIPAEFHKETTNYSIEQCPSGLSPFQLWSAHHLSKNIGLQMLNKRDVLSKIEIDIERITYHFRRNLEWNYIFDAVSNNNHPDRKSCHELIEGRDLLGDLAVTEKLDFRYHHIVFRFCSTSQQMFQKYAKSLKIKEEDVVKYNGELRLLAFSYKSCNGNGDVTIFDQIIIPLNGKMILVIAQHGKLSYTEFTTFQKFEDFMDSRINSYMKENRRVQIHL